MNCYPFIEAEKSQQRNVKRACELLKVSRSAYYAARGEPAAGSLSRDLMRGMPQRFRKAADLAAPLQILESRGWIRARPAPRSSAGGGRPGSPAWDVHPAIVSHQ